MLKAILLSSYLSLVGADVGITCHALGTGLHAEGNPIYFGTENCAKIAAIRGAGVAGSVFLIEKGVRTKKGKVIAYAVLAGISAVPVVLNARTIRNRR